MLSRAVWSKLSPDTNLRDIYSKLLINPSGKTLIRLQNALTEPSPCMLIFISHFRVASSLEECLSSCSEETLGIFVVGRSSDTVLMTIRQTGSVTSQAMHGFHPQRGVYGKQIEIPR